MRTSETEFPGQYRDKDSVDDVLDDHYDVGQFGRLGDLNEFLCGQNKAELQINSVLGIRFRYCSVETQLG